MKPDNEEELMDIANDNDDLPMDSASPQQQQQQQNNSSAPGDGGGGVARENGDGNVSGGDEHMEDDESRSQATFSFVIHNFSRLKESVLSPPTYVRNLPWKIMAMPRTGGQNSNQIGLKSLGYFLQCNGDSESTSWSCNAAADLRILAQKEGCEHISRRISHIFYSKENDWGFSYFTSWAELTDPAKGFLVDDTLILEATVTADAPHGVSWDSKKHTGFVGLKNQGATCYMNSLLQTLYFTNKLRKAVYQMPTESDDSTKSVALALQRVFYDLQFSDKPVGTKKLTKSFGWETLDSFMQHDVQELCRVLLDNMESKMKGTCVEGTIPALFEGKMISFIRCKHVTFSSSRTEPFYDIQLNIKDKKDIYESFVEYVSTESLDGENKYDAGDLGMQEAEKGITFESFPPVLHLHLLRFQYDPATDANVKINDRYEFPEKLNLDKFLSAPEATPADYTLHAVLVHSGDNHGGHYVVFINPKGDGKWCKFDDDVVSCCHKEDAINNNYGGGGELPPEDTTPVKQSTNAYMLVYIRNSALSDVLVPVTKDDIQEQLIERLLEEKRQEVLRRKERNDAHLYFSVSVYTEDSLMTYKGTDLINPDRAPAFVVKVAKQGGYQEAVATVAEALKYPACSIRVWPFLARNNHSYRPTRVVSESDYALSFIDSPNGNPAVFVEVAPARVPPAVLPPSEKDVHVLIFFKYYDVKNGFLTYCGLGHVRRRARVAELLPLMCEKAGLPAGTPLKVYEEEYISCIHPITNFELTMEEAVNELMDGDIIAFERADVTAPADGPADMVQFFNDLLHRVEVLFCDKTVPNDPGFLMELNLRMNYNQLAEAVALRLGTDPLKLQFFKNQSSYREGPGGPLKCNYEGTLKEILLYFKPRQPKKIYFQHLTISIHELENKRPFKCTYVNHKLKEEEFELFPNRSGTVADLLIEAAAKIDFSTAGEESTKQLRLLEILSSKINHIIPNDIILECLNPAGTKIYRVEEIPKDQLNLEPHEFLLPVAHFQKESYQTFGVPFLIKVKHNESFVTVKERIQKKLDVSDKEFEKYKFAIVSQRVSYITDEVGQIFRKEDHAINYSSSYSNSPKLWLGLDHVNKTPKRSRYSHYEKAIKIHN